MKLLQRLLPRTLFGQILLALFAGLIAVQSMGFWLMLDDRVRLGERLRGTYTAQRIAGIISILDHAGPADRNRLLHALNVPPTHLALSEPWHAATEPVSDDAASFIARVTQELGQPLTMQVLSIKRADIRHRDDTATAAMSTDARLPGPVRFGASADMHEEREERLRRMHIGPPILFVVGQVRLTDGAVLTFRNSLTPQTLDWPLRLLTLLIVLSISVVLLAAWVVRRLTRPLASLADAASGLARNLEQPPLMETGPLEVTRAAQAFNAMQRDLKRYLETRSQALAGVSHDLRLPITRLRLRLERLSDPELKAKMESDLTEMDDMIGSTLEFLRAGSVTEKTMRLDINALLDSVTEDMRTVGARIELAGHASGPLPARPQALRRCLANLLDNAHRYGGERIDMSVTESQRILEIRIEDRGPGIPAAELERVFEPYVRLESSRAKHTGGSGLGLAIARAIARSHGGDVVLVARPNGGITALLTLPRKPEE